MRSILLAIFLSGIGWFLPVSAQHITADSLEAIVQSGADDTLAVRQMCRLAGKLIDKDYNKALTYAKVALTLAESLKDPPGVAAANTLIGKIYLQLGIHDKALQHFIAAQSQYDIRRDFFKQGEANSYIGYVHYEMQNFDEALRYFRKAEINYGDAGIDGAVMYTRNNIASALLDSKQYDSASVYLNENLALLSDSSDLTLLSVTLNNLGEIHMYHNEPGLAAEKYRQALDLRKDTDSQEQIALVENNLAQALIKLEKYQEAEEWLDRAARRSEKAGARSRYLQSLEYRIQLREKQGRIAEAFAIQKDFIDLKDSLFNQNKSQLVGQLQAGHDTEQQQAEIEYLQKERVLNESKSDLQQKFLFALVGTVMLLAVVLFLMIRKNTAHKRARRQLEIQKKEVDRQGSVILSRNKELEEVIREKDGLISVVAHDLKSPLAKAAGLAHLVSQSGPVNEEQQQALDLIWNVCKDGGSLIRDLLDITMFEQADTKVQRRSTEINPLVQEWVAAFGPSAEAKNIRLTVELPEQTLTVETDASILNRIADNLLSNAIKFSERGKAVVMKIDADDKNFHLSVRDQGPGISEADRQKMFKKFQRLTARPTAGESSNGLGLAIVKLLTERLSGTIEVRSSAEEGTEFLLTFPRG